MYLQLTFVYDKIDCFARLLLRDLAFCMIAGMFLSVSNCDSTRDRGYVPFFFFFDTFLFNSGSFPGDMTQSKFPK